MSEDWDIRCEDCGKNHWFRDANRQEKMMLAVVKNAGAIAALAPLINSVDYDVELKTSYGNLDIPWFVKHLGHRLVVVSEYGRVSGEPLEPLAVPAHPVEEPVPPRDLD